MAREEKVKKKGSCLKTLLIIFGVFIILGIIGSALGGDNEPKKVADKNVEDSQKPEKEVKEEKTIFSIGETAEMNDVQITMMSYEESTGSEFNTPSEGNVFVLVNFEIANNSDSELLVSSMASFEAYADDYALNYSLSALLDKQDSTQLDGTVASGKKMNGWIGYEVPADWKNLEIHFTDNVWSSNKFIFNISK